MADVTPEEQPRRDGPSTEAAEKTATKSGESPDGSDDGQAAPAKAPPKPSFLARIGLDATTLKLMFKGSLPPIIAISMFQADSVAALFSTLGYEIPVITVLALAVVPRGKFIQNLTLNVLAICVGSAVSMLVLWSSIRARANTSPPPDPSATTPPAGGRAPYNSSQSAVCAVWLFSNIWLVNLIRAKFPPFALPAIIYSILVDIAATFGPTMTTDAQAEAFVRQLLTSMLLALALSAGVSLFVFPLSSRTIVMAQFGGAIGLLRRAVSLQKDYLQSLEREDMFALEPVETAVGRDPDAARKRRKQRRAARKGKPDAEPPLTKEAKAAMALREVITALRNLAGKIHGEIKFAKRDAAFGKLSAKDLSEIDKLFKRIFIPVTGMSTIMDIFRRTAEHRGWQPSEGATDEEVAEKETEKRIWNEVMKQLHEPFAILSEAIDQGLEHAGLQLQLLPRPKPKKGEQSPAGTGATDASADADVEARAGQQVKPGDPDFARVIDAKVKQFYSTRSQILRVWAKERGLMADGEYTYPLTAAPTNGTMADPREQRQAQLYVLLYLEQLMHATGEAVQDLVDFADKKVADGTMSRSHLLLPTGRRLRKWAASVFQHEDSTAEESPDSMEHVVYVGDSFGAKRDPEHLPATNAWQRFGNGVRAVSGFFGSPESMFGLRAACATMTVGIVCYLEQTQVFFQEQRLVWAMIIIAIGLTQTSGQSIFGFFCRVGGSFLAMIFAYIEWYIVDEKTAGVIVMLWFFIFWQYYFFLKFPRFIPASMITIITQVLIIGYELQVRKLGVARSEATGQLYYPTYELAPYRLATVAAGCLVAFFWTVFPSPTTDRAWMRRDLSAVLYLLANYFSAVNETVKTTMRQTGGDPKVSGTPAHQLAKVRQKLFSKLMLLLPSLEAHSGWQRWEPSVGGRFPKEAYDDIVLRSNRILNYLTLISYTVAWTPREAPQRPDGVWLEALSELIAGIGPTHYTILSTLTLLSNSLLSGQSLPPYIPLPRPYELTRRLLNLRNPYWQPSEWEAVSRKALSTATGEVERSSPPMPMPMPMPSRRPSRIAPVAALSSILDARNMEQHGYTEFAVLQVCSTLVCDDLGGLVQAVSGLVGVVDFSFRVVGGDSDEDETTSDSAAGEGRARGGGDGGGDGGGGVVRRGGSESGSGSGSGGSGSGRSGEDLRAATTTRSAEAVGVGVPGKGKGKTD